jgi:hypothetical protein
VKKTKSELISFLKNIARDMEITASISKTHSWGVKCGDLAGWADPRKNKIYIDSNLSKRKLAQCFFHEVGHIECLRTKKFFHYHNWYRDFRSYSEEQLRSIVRTALRAEWHADSLGKRLFKKHFPKSKIRWQKAYSSKEEIESLKEWVEPYRKRLARLEKK